jgi:hypothetical protein
MSPPALNEPLAAPDLQPKSAARKSFLKYNLFGRGLKLQIAITVACQIAFIFFGESIVGRINGEHSLTLSAGYDQGVFSGIVTNEDWYVRSLLRSKQD